MTASPLRQIRWHGDDPTSTGLLISDEVTEGCLFELHRQGGCGGGSLRLARSWMDRDRPPRLRLGDFISIASGGDRLYLGLITKRAASVPGGIELTLEGAARGLSTIFPGETDPQQRPLRLGVPNLTDFRHDPDPWAGHTANNSHTVARSLSYLLSSPALAKYRIGASFGKVHPTIDAPIHNMPLYGDESTRSLLKELAVRCGNVTWGVDAENDFYFRGVGSHTIRDSERRPVTLRVGREITRLEELDADATICNSVQLIGGHIYDRELSSEFAPRNYRFVATYRHQASLDTHGQRRLRLHVPWIRSVTDARNFSREFLRRYHQPAKRYVLEAVIPHGQPVPRPWIDEVTIEDVDGRRLAVDVPETVHVTFDHAAVVRMEIGPEDPRGLWPEPPRDDRHSRPRFHRFGSDGGSIDLTSDSVPSSGASSDDPYSSASSSESDVSSDWSSFPSNMGSDLLTTSDVWPDSTRHCCCTSCCCSSGCCCDSRHCCHSSGCSEWTSDCNPWSTGAITSGCGCESSGAPWWVQ